MDDGPKVIEFPGVRPAGGDLAEVEIQGCPVDLLPAAIEACLFAASAPVPLPRLAAATGCTDAEVEGALTALSLRLSEGGSGLRLCEIGDGWQLRTDARFARFVGTLRGTKPARLGRAALETLAVVAFRQPVTKGQVDDLRGVDSGGVLRGLLERGLVRALGRSDEPGRAIAYGTTEAFLELFGMRSLADLPTLKDLHALDDDAANESVVPVVAFPGHEGIEVS
jgi:segregation and condensation protein B